MSHFETISDNEVAVGMKIINDFLNPILHDLIKIPVAGEIGIPSRDRGLVQFEYNPMIVHRNRRPLFRLNGDQSFLEENTDYVIDLDLAQIELTSGVGSAFEDTAGTLTAGNEIAGDYRFKYFEDEDLVSFLVLGLFELNLRKPATAFTLISAPREWDAPLALYAYIQIIERILSDITMWRSRVIFADPEFTRSTMEAKLGQANQKWDFLAKVTKRRGIVRPAGIITRKLAVQQRVTSVNFRDFAI